MHNEWLNYSTLRLPAGNNSLFWLRRENDRMRRCRRTFISADSKCWQWQLKSQVVFMCFSLKKNSEHLAARDVLSVMAFEHRHRHHNVLYWFSGIPLKKHSCLFRQKQGVPLKSAWHHWTRTLFNKLHKLVAVSSLQDTPHLWDSS